MDDRSRRQGQWQSPLSKRPREEPDDNDSPDRIPKLKRSRTSGLTFSERHTTQIKLSREDYTVGWICAIAVEMTAATAMLDSFHADIERNPSDENTYVLGAMSGHNVVIVCLPHGQYGTNSAAVVAKDMLRSFPSINVGLMVGIGGGVPRAFDIRLGDIIVSDRVVQYDFGKTGHNGQLKQTGTLNKPPRSLLTAVSSLRARHQRDSSEIPIILAGMLQRYPAMSKYVYQGADQDRLFESTYKHTAASCDLCDVSKLVKRTPRADSNPRIYYGVIASGNQVMKDAETRDRLAEEHNILCFEMEAAGLMDAYPCLVIRGICDYSDSHKAKPWQEYAAATAAAYAKEFLSTLPSINKISMMNRQKETEDQQKQLLESLRFDQIDSRHSTIKTALDNTCQWLREHADYLEWRDIKSFPNHHGFLWISGKPGTGKSTIMKFAFGCSKAEAETNNENAAVISFFFNARGDKFEKTIIGMFRSLLYQLVENLSDLTEVISEVLTESTVLANTFSWDLNLLKKAFSESVKNIGDRQVTCFIDALDECNEDEVRDMVDFFEEIGRGTASIGTRFYICFSSRHYPHITIKKGIRLILEDQGGHEKDMKKYVRSRLRTEDQGKTARTKHITAHILKKASGVFMWVVLVVDILNKEIDRGRMLSLESKLDELPTKLSDLFRDILTRDNEDMDELLLSIQWILFSKRPLKPEEYFFAMAAGLHQDHSGEWDREAITRSQMDRFVVSSSKGLAESTKSDNATVQFIHQSVRDYLLKDYGLESLWPELGQDRDRHSHETLKQCCSKYLSLNFSPYLRRCNAVRTTASMNEYGLKKPIELAEHVESEVTRKFPFLEYATKHVLYHSNIASSWVPQSDFIRKFPIKRWVKLHNIFVDRRSYGYSPDAGRAHIFVDNDLVSLLRTFLRDNCRFDISWEKNRNVLRAAVEGGHDSALQELLSHIEKQSNRESVDWNSSRGPSVIEDSSSIELPDHRGRTLLFLAAAYGQDNIVKLLLDRGACAGARDKRGRTPLFWAVMNGRGQVVRLLLGANCKQRLVDGSDASEYSEDEDFDTTDPDYPQPESQIDMRDEEGNTPLFYAIQCCQEEMARILLRAGADVHTTNHDGDTPLHAAAAVTNGSLTKLLLKSGVDVHRKNKLGQAPIHLSASKGSVQNLGALLRAGADANCRDGAGDTPLMLAYGSCRAEETTAPGPRLAVRLRVPVSSRRWHVRRIGVQYQPVLMLLDAGADINGRNDLGRTILFEAYAKQDFAFVEDLISMGADTAIADNNGQTPLFATPDPTKFPDNLAKLLLQRGANVKDRDSFVRDLLRIDFDRMWSDEEFFYQVWPRIEDSVREALHNGVDVDMRDSGGRTPLMKAIKRGDATFATFLLRNGANANLLDVDSLKELAEFLEQEGVAYDDPDSLNYLPAAARALQQSA